MGLPAFIEALIAKGLVKREGAEAVAATMGDASAAYESLLSDPRYAKMLGLGAGAAVLASPSDSEAMPKVFRGYMIPEAIEGKWWTPSKQYAKHYSHKVSTGGVAEADIPDNLKLLNMDTNRDYAIYKQLTDGVKDDFKKGLIGGDELVAISNEKLKAAGYAGTTRFRGQELHLIDVPEITNKNILRKVGIGAGLGLMGAAGLAAPPDADAMYVGAKPTELGAFSSLMDRMVRKEIPDVGMKLKMRGSDWADEFGRVKTKFVSDAIDHPELFSQYPDLKNLKVTKGNQNVYSGDKITLTDPSNRSVWAHELQHPIQEKEGWARGSSPAHYNDNLNIELGNKSNDYSKYASDKMIQDIVNASRAGDLKTVFKLKSQDEEAYTIANRLYKEIGKYPTPDVLHNEALRLSKEADNASSMRQYLRTAGEIESRDTAARMGMSGIERSRTAPYSSENIPLSDVIVKGVQPRGKLAYGAGGAGLMSMMAPRESQAGPTIENARQMMVNKYEGGGLEPGTFDPGDVAAAAATGGGSWLAKLIAVLAEQGINTGINYATGR
jgi:hypothetical protein